MSTFKSTPYNKTVMQTSTEQAFQQSLMKEGILPNTDPNTPAPGPKQKAPAPAVGAPTL